MAEGPDAGAASGLALSGTPVVKIKFRIRNEARWAAAPPADWFGGPAAGRDGAGVGPAGRGPARRGAGAACRTGSWRLTRPGWPGTVPANPGAARRPAVTAGAGPLRRAVPDCRGRARLGVGFGTVPAPTPGRRGPVRGGRWFGGLPGPAGAGPIQPRLLGRRGQVAVHARPTGRHRTTTRNRPTGRHRRVTAASPATIGCLVGRGPRTTPGTAVGIKITRPAGLLTGWLRCGRAPPWPGRFARRGGPGVTGSFAWGGGSCVAAGPVAWCTGTSVPARCLTRAAGPARCRLPGCARPVVAAGCLPGRPGTPIVGRCRRPAITG